MKDLSRRLGERHRYRATMFVRWVITTIVLTATVGCNSRAPAKPAQINQRGGVFSAFGTLTSDDGAWIVTATRRSQHLVDYAIMDAATETVHATGGGFSDTMQWFLYWDDQNRLWTHNSDMGPLGVWLFDGDKAFSLHRVKAGDEMLDTIPTPVLENLPGSLLGTLQLKSQ